MPTTDFANAGLLARLATANWCVDVNGYRYDHLAGDRWITQGPAGDEYGTAADLAEAGIEEIDGEPWPPEPDDDERVTVRRALPDAATEWSIEFLAGLGYGPDDLDDRGDEVGDQLQTLLALAYERMASRVENLDAATLPS